MSSVRPERGDAHDPKDGGGRVESGTATEGGASPAPYGRAAGARGAALVSAIFLLVVLAAVGAYMLTLSGVEQSTANRALLAARAHYAARAGIEWGIHRARNAAGTMCGVSPAVTTTSFTLTGSGFDGFNIAVGCTSTDHNGTALNEGTFGSPPGTAANFSVFYLTSTATHGSPGDLEHAERRIEAIVSNRYP